MTHASPHLSASLREYLCRLQESGLDGIPAGYTDTHDDSTSLIPSDWESCVSVAAAPVRESLECVRKALGNCQRCPLCKGRKQIVFGYGNPHARLLFVSEAPSADENNNGDPFAGDVGQILNRIITAMGLQREDIYICTAVKCHPPHNRTPDPLEIAACAPFLQRQITAIKPDAIVALGKLAAQTLLESSDSISRLRGKFHDCHGIPLMPTYHPSYLLRPKGDNAPFWEVWDDMTQVLRLLGLPVPDKGRKTPN